MKISSLLLLIFGSVILTGGAFAFGYYVGQDTTEEDVQASTSSSSDSSSSGGSSLSVIGADGSSNDSNALPQPSEFSVYEQFANEEGVRLQEIEEGDGQTAEAGDTVAMLYRGWFTDGTLFDQSRTNDQGQLEPFVLTLGAGQVIQGWEQGIIGMKEGGSRRLIIPSSLGYGPTGSSTGSIPPDTQLIFDVELLQLQKPTGL